MIVTLTLKNFVLIHSLTLSFSKGFHVFTGETGAGKTLLVQAIHLITGQKVSTDIIRQNEEKALLEATFDIEHLSDVQKALYKAGIEFDPNEYLVIKREIMRSKKNRIFINAQLVPLSLLLKIGPLILSLISQNSAQSLRKPEAQRAIIDKFGNLDLDIKSFSSAYYEENTLQKKLTMLENEKSGILLENLKLEYKDWSHFNYQKNEEEILFNEYKNLALFHEDLKKIRTIQEGLDNSPILTHLNQYKKLANGSIKEHINTAILSLQDASYLSTQKLTQIKFDPERYDEIEKRLSKLNSLKKKYGTNTDDILSYVEKLKTQIDALENQDSIILSLKKQLSEKKKSTLKLAQALSIKREETAKILSKKLNVELQQLNIPNAQLDIRIDSKEIGPNGCDQVSIYLTTNEGEEPASLEANVSGGELSRLFFTVTLLLAEKTSIPTLIIDEIDSNIGGETATLVGKKLQTIGIHTQILAISHFPQVACFADHHFQITKIEDKGRTFTKIYPLKLEQIKDELFRMSGGYQVIS